MKKINVIGTSGSGKSTFSKNLSEKLGYPLIEMDALFWKENWEHLSDDEFKQKIAKETSRETWVLDGNYNRTREAKWRDVDTIIWIDYSFSRTFLQLLKRSLSRAGSKKELWQGTGNKETFQKTFFSKDSILLWCLQTYWKNKKRYSQLQKIPEYAHINLIRLSSPSQTKEFINKL